MFNKTACFTFKIFLVLAISSFLFLLPQYAMAQASQDTTLERDIFYEQPITAVEDLPDEITFSLYDSETALTPISTQTFPRGKYTLDFEFNKSDGLASGSVARSDSFKFKIEAVETLSGSPFK